MSSKYSIVNNSDLESYHDIFISDHRMSSLRKTLREQDRNERVDCADAFREYEKFAVSKYLTYKEILNVI